VRVDSRAADGKKVFATLEDALDAVAPAGVVELPAGRFPASLEIAKSVTLRGAGAEATILDGEHQGRVLLVRPQATVVLTGLAVVHGSTENLATEEDGAGILNLGRLECMDCAILDNVSRDDGGGIGNAGILVLTRCELRGNHAGGRGGVGGGLYNAENALGGGLFRLVQPAPCQARLTACRITGNTAASNGGGIWSEAEMSLRTCTIAENRSGDTGGGVRNNGVLTVGDCTIVANRAASEGGGLSNYGRAVFVNTLAAQNAAPAAPDVSGRIESRGYNLVARPEGANFVQQRDSDQFGTATDAPLIEQDGNFHGVYVPAPDSPAIDAGGWDDDAFVKDDDGAAPSLDVLGGERVLDGDGDGVARRDIGAVERAPSQDAPRAPAPAFPAPPNIRPSGP
jgi:hypothetical protein